MQYGICNLSIVPLRNEPSDKSELISQLLFGEHFKILETRKKWSKIRLAFDKYEGWISFNQYEEIDKETYTLIDKSTPIFAAELIDFATDESQNFSLVTLGSNLPLFQHNNFFINGTKYKYEGDVYREQLAKEAIVKIAYKFLNTPFLWGGKTSFGIDSSGFTQLVYKLCGYMLFREASQQAGQGEALSFIEESEPGDLAFFDNSEGEICHVGIILKDHYIIHAHGKVRIDRIDHSGIFNQELNKHTHKLRVIKKIV
jgi:hypothetical protein